MARMPCAPSPPGQLVFFPLWPPEPPPPYNGADQRRRCRQSRGRRHRRRNPLTLIVARLGPQRLHAPVAAIRVYPRVVAAGTAAAVRPVTAGRDASSGAETIVSAGTLLVEGGTLALEPPFAPPPPPPPPAVFVILVPSPPSPFGPAAPPPPFPGPAVPLPISAVPPECLMSPTPSAACPPRMFM